MGRPADEAGRRGCGDGSRDDGGVAAIGVAERGRARGGAEGKAGGSAD